MKYSNQIVNLQWYIDHYNNFIGHCGVFCGLKWRIQWAKIYFSLLPSTNQKRESIEASQSELETIQLFAQFSRWLAAKFKLSRDLSSPLQTFWGVCNDKMAEKPNKEANSQSAKLDENELQNLQEESRLQSECKFAFVEWNSLDQFMYLCRPHCLLVIFNHF